MIISSTTSPKTLAILSNYPALYLTLSVSVFILMISADFFLLSAHEGHF